MYFAICRKHLSNFSKYHICEIPYFSKKKGLGENCGAHCLFFSITYDCMSSFIIGFSSPCTGTPGGFGQGGAMGGSSANISCRGSINLIPRVLFYSQTPLYGHPLDVDTSLLQTVCFVSGKRKLLHFL